jgi:DNA-binding transcriptional ArsR family regulator
VVEDSLTLDGVFHALAHAVRRDMLRRLADRERTVGELAAPLSMSLAAASKHVKVLELAGLVDREVRGREHVCRLAPRPLAAASDWLARYERFWTQRLDDLDAPFRAEPGVGRRASLAEPSGPVHPRNTGKVVVT